ncbi:hypothetical protein AAFF_G00414890 [Aldrovandia affinis]|uniref:Uncharacterized protein n=1 Tax=Aldrovandia affinis TaxID=143900 RepID=A0AAD7SAT1_9TELE|nr:hypothetical protein AAFF_G00414890 [Aldrovandia affinis]
MFAWDLTALSTFGWPGMRRSPKGLPVSESGHSATGTCCGFPFPVGARVRARHVLACWETQPRSQLLSVARLLFLTAASGTGRDGSAVRCPAQERPHSL